MSHPSLPDPSAGLTGALLGLASFGLYALCDVTIKFMGQDMTSVQVIFVAGLCSLPFILAQAAMAGGDRSLRPVLPGWVALRVGLILVNSVIVSYTFTRLPLAQAYAIFFCMPLLITLFAVPMLGERLDLPRLLAVLTGLAGVLIALRPGSEPMALAHLTAIMGATLGALNSIILRLIGGRERAAVMMLYPALAQAIVLAAVMPFLWQPMSALHWGLGGMIGLFSTVAGLAIIRAYVRAPAIVVAPMQYSQIIWAAALGALIFGEAMDGPMILGIGVIVGAGLFLLWKAGRA
jgi:S-adenosylmethionine uptake transporter